jgi:hypothetical protein
MIEIMPPQLMQRNQYYLSEEYKQGRTKVICFELLLTGGLIKAGQTEQNHIKILGATMTHALTFHAKKSRLL